MNDIVKQIEEIVQISLIDANDEGFDYEVYLEGQFFHKDFWVKHLTETFYYAYKDIVVVNIGGTFQILFCFKDKSRLINGYLAKSREIQFQNFFDEAKDKLMYLLNEELPDFDVKIQSYTKNDKLKCFYRDGRVYINIGLEVKSKDKFKVLKVNYELRNENSGEIKHFIDNRGELD